MLHSGKDCGQLCGTSKTAGQCGTYTITNLRSLPSFKAHSVPCGVAGCRCCRAMSRKEVIHTAAGGIHHTPSGTSCDSSGVIYLLTCKECDKQYVGETLRPLKTRIAGHRNVWKTKNMPLYLHLLRRNHATFDSLVITILEVVKAPTKAKLLCRDHWISAMKCEIPHELNSKFASRQEISTR